MIGVLLAEDQALLRQALAEILDREDDIVVVAQVGRGDEVLAAALSARPDVALVDIEMPGRDGIVCTADLREHLPSCRVLVLTVFNRPGYLRRALESGATGYILKDAAPRDLVRAIREAAAGGRVVDPALATTALYEGASPLSAREREVLALTREGASVEEIARTLGLSRGTVRNHLSIAIQKLDARTRFDAARLAEEKGWL
ncbi:MAG TPA: response regulator transcription factor [Candidatus Dormibacteraeota bacterium]|nr:response regulator transcription factor [Candidatus Dormibacteraeota bacterium]